MAMSPHRDLPMAVASDSSFFQPLSCVLCCTCHNGMGILGCLWEHRSLSQSIVLSLKDSGPGNSTGIKAGKERRQGSCRAGRPGVGTGLSCSVYCSFQGLRFFRFLQHRFQERLLLWGTEIKETRLPSWYLPSGHDKTRDTSDISDLWQG